MSEEFYERFELGKLNFISEKQVGHCHAEFLAFDTAESLDMSFDGKLELSAIPDFLLSSFISTKQFSLVRLDR